MNSILDRDGPQKITIEPDNLPDILLPLVILIVIVIFLGVMLYILLNSNFQTTETAHSIALNGQLMCPIGQCATNILSGFKRCPTEQIAIPYNPAEEVCNDRYLCNNTITPYALNSDGSTNYFGQCEPNVECSCLRINQCPNYMLSIFTANGGNPYNPLTGQRIMFPQVTGTPPIPYTIGTTFCAAPLAWLPLSNPGCNFVTAANGNSMTYDDLVLCMGLISGCSGPQLSPCLQGILAAITNDPDSLTQDNIVNAQYGCVRGSPCPCNQIAIFDTNYGDIICRSL